ncbi:hypothetical protein LEP1GSC170_2310 [Leptospira interrogans serovar Bataviae str. HAI135]|nr:hypothetical protein LEP1GSC170_2310 [Leptospira interrogans serovar Bataviae str. HAI135]
MNRLKSLSIQIQKMFQKFIFCFESFNKSFKLLRIKPHQTIRWIEMFKLSNKISFGWKKFPFICFYFCL